MDVKSANSEDQTDLEPPLVLLVDEDDRKVTKCYTASNEPLTVIMHEYGKFCTAKNRCGHEGGRSLCFQICSYLYTLSMSLTSMPDLIMRNSSVASEFFSRRCDLQCAIQEHNDSCSCVRNSRCAAVLANQLMNILFGIGFMVSFYIYGPWMASVLLSHIDSVVRSMILLLDWLMGVPAGLKLNYNLTAFLGRFFMYHIWLWAEYLKLAGQHFDVIFGTIAIFGLPGGASLQIALIQDALKIFLLHIYCFYIYSSRLFFLTCYSLQALWRLFRGLKWNTLRKRVDHASYDNTQLFVGTLLFAILLFILPTVFLYYLVFAILRSLVIAVHYTLDKLRYVTTHVYELAYKPLLKACYKLFYQDKHGFSVQPSSGGNITVLTMHHQVNPLCTILTDDCWHKMHM